MKAFLCRLGLNQMAKRGGEQLVAVDVQGFGRRWKFATGMPAQEAMALISAQVYVRADSLVMEVVGDEFPVILPKHHTLEIGNKYRVFMAMTHSPWMVPRRFGAGLAVMPDLYYYVPPKIDALVKDLKEGKYCILCGSRQSGKSTSVLAARTRLSIESYIRVVYMGGGLAGAAASWDGNKLWCYLWDSLYLACPDIFRARAREEDCDDVKFRSLFVKETLLTPAAIVLDEADSILDLSPACIHLLFHVIRVMKGEPQRYNIHGFLLVGTECLRDLLEVQYEKRKEDAVRSGREYKPGSTPSRLSPFPHDHVLPSTLFSLEDVISLLNQAAADRPGVHIDVDELAASIMQWTCGHKGLTGTCLAYLVQEELWTLKAWLKEAESYHLGSYIFGQATYNRIKQFVRLHGDKDEFYPSMVRLLEVEELPCDEDKVLALRDFIAQGVLVATTKASGLSLSISSPLLRTALLRDCTVVCQEVDLPPDPHRLDRRWVLLQTIVSLDGDSMCRPECLNARGEPSEYAHQFLFVCSIKAVINQAHPLIGAKVLPEAKQVPIDGRRHSQLRLDILVRDGVNFSKFGFELVANGSERAISEHIQRAIKYQELHSAQVFVINFCSNRDQEYLVPPTHDSVVFVSVCFNVVENSAAVTFVEPSGIQDVVEVPLKKWTGKISFAKL